MKLSLEILPPHFIPGLKEKFSIPSIVSPSVESEELALKRKKEEEFAAKVEQVRKKYIALKEAKNRPAETQKVAQLLTKKGFSVALNEEKSEIIDLDWKTKELDFTAFAIFIDELRETASLSDEEFKEYIPTLAMQLGGNGGDIGGNSPLYTRLNDDAIDRSKAHVFNPHDHSTAVGENTITDGLDAWKVFRARFDYEGHDIGKVAIANGDITHVHGEISYLIWRQFFRENPLPEFRVSDEQVQNKLIDLFLRTIRFHHIFEAVQFGALSQEEVIDVLMQQPFSEEELTYLQEQQQSNPDLKIITPEESLFMLGVLAPADAGSVDLYIPYAVANAAKFIEIFSQLGEIDWSLYPKEYFKKFYEWLEKMMLTTISESPAVFLSELRVLASDDISYSEQQVTEAVEAHKAFRNFATANGILTYKNVGSN